MASLTSSIQCTSSITYSAGAVRARAAVFNKAANRAGGHRGDGGRPAFGVADSEQVVEQQQVLGVGVGDSGPHPRAAVVLVECR